MEQNLRNLTDSLVTDCLVYRGGPLIIIADNRSLDIGQSILESVEETETCIEKAPCLINLDNYRKGKPLTSLPKELRQEFESRLEKGDEEHNTILYICHRLDGERPMTREIMKIGEAHGKMGGLPSCTIDVLTAAFHPSNVSAFSKELYDFLSTEEEILLTCDRGTNLIIRMDHNKYNLVNSNGVLIPGKYGNPIPAEVYAHPVSADGQLVISGSYGPLMSHERFIGKFDALLQTLDKSPIKWSIRDDKVTDVYCEDEEIENFVKKEVFELDAEYGSRVGEIGLPANLYVLSHKMTGNLLIDEKGRVHLAHGDGYKKRTACEYETTVHGDGLVGSATLISGKLGQPFMKDNEYSPEIFKTLRK
ncbi:MAG: hypothetical protein V1802_02690 [Candidatus Aenigmatarchaeota archaeon]